MDQKLEKWLRWLKVVYGDITQLLIKRDIFWKVQEIIKNNKSVQKPSPFYRYLGDTYVAYITMGVRRHIEIDQKRRQSISFAHLLSEIVETPSLLSREYYKSVRKDKGLADSEFNHFVGDIRDHISPSMVCNDLNLLKNTAEKVKVYADKIIAHRDKNKPKIPPTFDEVDECLNVLDRLYVKYHQIFHGEGMETAMPIYTYDWTEIFREPWLSSETEPYDY